MVEELGTKEIVAKDEINKDYIREYYFIRKYSPARISDNLGISIPTVFSFIQKITDETIANASSNVTEKFLTEFYFTNNEIMRKAWKLHDEAERDADRINSLKLIKDCERDQFDMFDKLGLIKSLQPKSEGRSDVRDLIRTQINIYQQKEREKEALKKRGEVIDVNQSGTSVRT